MRKKLKVEKAMIQLVHENGVLKEEIYELKDAKRDFYDPNSVTGQ